MATIREDIKTSLNINPEDTSFDIEIQLFSDTALGIINQLGVGEDGLKLTNETTWEELDSLTGSNKGFDLVKTYMLLKVRLYFDPPTASTLSHYNNALDDLEWRIQKAYAPNYYTPNVEVVNEEE